MSEVRHSKRTPWVSYFCLLPYEHIIIIALKIWDIMESVTVVYTASMNRCSMTDLYFDPGSRSGSRSPLPWSWKPPAAQLKELTCYQLKETVLSSSSSDQQADDGVFGVELLQIKALTSEQAKWALTHSWTQIVLTQKETKIEYFIIHVQLLSPL